MKRNRFSKNNISLLFIKKRRITDLTERICQSLREVKLIKDGKLKAKSIDELLNELGRNFV